MKLISKLKNAKSLSKEQQKDLNGGKTPLVFIKRDGCVPAISCCYHNGTTWVQGPPCF
ncbi:hypothetical protein [Aquimarina muelleri]|uniref:Uncharacterized protein n=1 Tax=Aquimarina muelleri TaxID=279356 RepID=A0A918JTR4_9FLAO|nr:hypothetical protein [Aquimarina muelleri]MCX2761365.1 hypothetical protein [Aquimarina muelleri]GGX13106.1 hypothetical protein GCM10007384_13370 [Aquimarina muelleri]